MSPRVSVEVVADFFLQDFDKSSQVGVAGIERGREDWEFLIKGSHCGVVQSRSVYLAPRYRITWRSKKLEMERSEKESIAVVQVGSKATPKRVNGGNRRRNKILQNEPYLPSRRRGPSLTWPTLTLCLYLGGIQYVDVLWIYELSENEGRKTRITEWPHYVFCLSYLVSWE